MSVMGNILMSKKEQVSSINKARKGKQYTDEELSRQVDASYRAYKETNAKEPEDIFSGDMETCPDPKKENEELSHEENK